MRALLGCLDMQSAALAEFARALDREAQALSEGRFKDLQALVRHKTELARQIAELDRERERLQAETGFAPEAPRPGQEALERAWGQLREHAGQARLANHRNGVMVHTLLDFTRQAVASLQGGQRPLYGSDGRPAGSAVLAKPLAQG